MGGLAQEVNEEDLKEYFEKYGEVSQIDLKRNSLNGRSRGFAFVVFKEVETLNKVLLARSHMIKGQEAIVERALAKRQAHRGGFRDDFGRRGRKPANRGGFSGNRGGFRGGLGGHFGRGRGRGGFKGGFGGRRGHVFNFNNYA